MGLCILSHCLHVTWVMWRQSVKEPNPCPLPPSSPLRVMYTHILLAVDMDFAHLVRMSLFSENTGTLPPPNKWSGNTFKSGIQFGQTKLHTLINFNNCVGCTKKHSKDKKNTKVSDRKMYVWIISVLDDNCQDAEMSKAKKSGRFNPDLWRPDLLFYNYRPYESRWDDPQFNHLYLYLAIFCMKCCSCVFTTSLYCNQ
jgi:hypothetical protein